MWALARRARPDRLVGGAAAEPAQVLRTLLIAGIAVLIVALLASIALQADGWRVHLPYVAMLGSHALALALAHTGRVRLAVGIHATLYLIMAGVAMFFNGGVEAPAFFVLPPIVLFVGLTWSGRAAIVTAIAASVLVFGMLGLEHVGQLPPARPPTPESLAVGATCALVITGVLLHVATRVISRSRAELQDEERQRHALEGRLVEARRLETVGRLAAGVAHDFNNLLTVIFTQAGFLARQPSLAVAEAAAAIRQVAERGAALTRQLLAVGRRQVLELTVLDPRVVVRELEPLLRGIVGGRARLILDVEAGGLVRLDRVQLEQALLNLVSNAGDAMPRGGAITVRSDVAPGVLHLAVIDEGEGMDEAVRARIFEPFFTTKPRGQGSGLGLATVQGFVAQSGGRIEVASAPGKGSTFTIELPLVEEPASEPTSRVLAPERRAAGAAPPALVLVVDDDAQILAAARQILVDAGHDVRVASSAAQALEIGRAEGQRLGLLLTDVVMPEVSGPELARRLRETHPGLKVMFMSGHAAERITEDGAVLEGVHFIAKPFENDGLVEKVAAVLASASPGTLGHA